ncbi:hypothetical protein F5Y03DRAFT_397996 [Xylaria venustula]|nr:hypothetical protein F5Y03DRAFT_397996 [Xylaria venustula]
MCKIICNIDLEGNRKRGEEDALCLIPGHCWAFGIVRKTNIVDELLCSACFITQTKKREDLSDNTKKRMISKATIDAEFHSTHAEKHIKDAEKKSKGDINAARIAKVTDLALERLEFAFADEQMQSWHFEELLQIIASLPFLNKKKLIRKFAKEAEEKFDAEDITWFYELSMESRDFGNGFRQGLKNPNVLNAPYQDEDWS